MKHTTMQTHCTPAYRPGRPVISNPRTGWQPCEHRNIHPWLDDTRYLYCDNCGTAFYGDVPDHFATVIAKMDHPLLRQPSLFGDGMSDGQES